MLKEFREFAMKGNMLDLAAGVIIGAAFGTIITSLVNDILMPPIGMLLGGLDFSNLFLVLKQAPGGVGDFHTAAEAAKAGAVTLNYGIFINAVINFLIVAFCIFMVIKSMNRFKKAEAEAPAAPPKSEVLLEEIRDLLKAKG